MTEQEPGRELEVLSTEQCYQLLANHEIGRLGVIAEHYPLILPVNYALDQHTIVLRMDQGTKLAAANHANVTFEVDDINRHTRTGWSVLVRGLAEELTPAHRADLIQRTKASGVQPWAPGEHGHWMRLIAHAITGRRIVPGELPPAFEPAAYL